MRIDEFLLARIAEDEAVVYRWDSDAKSRVAVMWAPGYATVASEGGDGEWLADGHEVLYPRNVMVLFDPARVLRECEAKRRMVDAVIDLDLGCGHTADQIRRDECDDGIRRLRILAAVYSDHPDYDPAWSIDNDTHEGRA